MYLSNLSHQIIYLKFQQQPFFFFGKLKIHGGKNYDFFFFLRAENMYLNVQLLLKVVRDVLAL